MINGLLPIGLGEDGFNPPDAKMAGYEKNQKSK
jgi:hypothetical protein